MTIQEALQEANPCDGRPGCKCEQGKYYVSAVKGDGGWLMAGPYETHGAAQADRSKALKIADDIDGRAWFMAWGVVRMPDDYTTPGVLNKHGLI